MMTGKVLVAALVIFIAIGWWVNGAESQQFVTDGLIGFWPLDKDTIKGKVVEDVWGKNDGTIVGEPKSVPGKINEALEFDGQDDCVQFPDMGEEIKVTVEVWLNCSLPKAHGGIVSSFPADQWGGHNGTVHFKFEVDEIWATTPEVWPAGKKVGFSPAEKNAWYHAAYTRNANNGELKLYINGELVDESEGGKVTNNLTHVCIACEHDGRYFQGTIDEVRIYKRVLSADEILQNSKVISNKLAVEAAGKLAITWGLIKSEK